MNIYLKDILRPVVTIISIALSATMAMASDLSPSDKAYEHYVCGAYEQYGADDVDMKAKCNKLADDGFDLGSWESSNKDKSIKLQEKAFSIFF